MQLACIVDAAPAITPRRRLAPNVICLFAEDRPPVINPRWRGRYPRNVTKKGRYFWRRWGRKYENAEY